MADGDVGILKAIWRFFTFYNLRKGRRILDAAHRQFTGSAEGIADAYDIQQDRMIRQFNELRDAISQVEGVLEDKKDRLNNLNEEEQEVIIRRDGATAKAEEAQHAGNQLEYEKHAAAFQRFDSRITEIEETQGRLEKEIADSEVTMKRYMMQLTEMQAEVQKMPQDKAEAIADFVSNTKIIELNDRLLGLQSSFDRGPLDAVRKANKDLSAKARITEKLAGTDVRVQDREYATAGRTSAGGDKLSKILAARKAEREGEVTPQQTVRETTTAERPKI